MMRVLRRMRPTETKYGRECFVPNKIVAFLFEYNKDLINLDKIGRLVNRGIFSEEEMEEFYQLLGYPIHGYEEIFGEIDWTEDEKYT